MKSKDFIAELNKVQELMFQENYNEAMKILEELKKIEKEGNFNYDLTHKLYQLDSNTQSLYNQQKILDIIFNLSQQKESISFKELQGKLRENADINLDEAILKREIEILILRGLLSCNIEKNDLVF